MISNLVKSFPERSEKLGKKNQSSDERRKNPRYSICGNVGCSFLAASSKSFSVGSIMISSSVSDF